jgi:hypothetical protein
LMKARWALLLLLIPAAQAAINSDHAFEAEYPFMEGFGGDAVTITSGMADVQLTDATGAFGFFDTQGFSVTQLDRVCWMQSGTPTCESGNLALHVAIGGSAAIDLPGTVDGLFHADHALGLFIDYGKGEDLNSYGLEQTLMAPAIGGAMEFGKVQEIPFAGLLNMQSLGGLVGLDDATTIQLSSDGTGVRSFQGKDAQLSFSGQPIIGRIETGLAVLPFEAGSIATFSPATDGDASEGLDLSRVNDMLRTIDEANAKGSNTQGNFSEGIEDVEDLLAAVLNGAVLRLPIGENATADDFAMIRFEQLNVRARGDGSLAWSGSGPLAIQSGQVAGAPNLIGVGFFALPIWSIVLWVAAIGIWVARLVVRPPKEHPTWDRFKWIGWVFGAVAFVVLFILWDLEVRSVWGTSLLAGDTTGRALLVTAAVQLAPLFFVMFAAAAPIRMILRNGLLLGRQGTFMGLSGGVAYLLAYAVGATLLLAYIELVIQAVAEKIGG